MTVAQTGVVDWLGIEKDTGDVVLTVVDDLDWRDEHAHLLALQEKLNTYLAFIESEEVFERLHQQTGKWLSRQTPIKVSILAKYPMPDHGQAFIEYAQQQFGNAGCSLVLKVIQIPH